jgi:UDP-2-acetamido-2,6-beta-L-arabino-hexul-4-ose reductase
MKIGITGITGLIGWHLRAYLQGRPGVEVRGATRDTFVDPAAMAQFVSGLDAVAHLAGMNRGEDAEIEAINVHLVDALIEACERTASRPHIVFSSSTHIERDTVYGRSKREGAARLRRWAEKHGARFTNLILPHVFGEFGKPFYNSAVSTFCHQLAMGETPSIIVDGQLRLIHTQQVAARMLQIVTNGEDGEVGMEGEPLTVSELLARLGCMADLYNAQLVPDLRPPLDLQLFNTYRSYLFPHFYPVSAKLYSDDRGHLFEAVRSLNGGQVFLSTTHPGITRGNHYHTRKVERFLVAQGEAVIRMRKLFSSEVLQFQVSGAPPQYIDMPTFYTHSITNVGNSDLLTLFWTHEIFDPTNSDTYPEPVVAV